MEVFGRVRDHSRGDLNETVNMVDTGSTALANEP